jgi:hypothetical protein
MAISYTKTNWQDAPSTATPITAAQLNRMEKGIEDCCGQGNANELAIAANAEAIQILESGIQLGSISITQLLLMAHPIGSIYSSTAATSPADLFGGTWERIKGAFIWGIDDGETAGVIGGEKTHTLTTDEMPSHVHAPNKWVQVMSPGGNTGTIGQTGTKTGPYKDFVSAQNYNSSAVGGGQAHNNMPPYYGAYVWRRTA